MALKPLPKLRPVTSSNVKAIRWLGLYEYADHGIPDDTLEVYFLDGSVYRYYGVKYETFMAMLNAPSKGQFVWRHLRDRYPYDKTG